jgi:hypothetical protein
MQKIRLIKPLTIFCLLAFTSYGFAQTWPGSSASSAAETAPPVMSVQDRALLSQNSLDQAPVGADECDLRFPYPPSAAKKDPYAENGPEICKSLEIRGQRMQCEIDALVGDRAGGPSTTGAKIELASWARCNSKVASMLVAGYYIPASEIERRLQVCSSNFYADPGKAPRLGWYQRFLKWYTSNDLTPPPSDATLEISIKQSTPIDSQQDMAGLMKCDYMFSRSKTPFIDPLPGGGQVGITSPPVAPRKGAPKSAVNKTQ